MDPIIQDREKLEGGSGASQPIDFPAVRMGRNDRLRTEAIFLCTFAALCLWAVVTGALRSSEPFSSAPIQNTEWSLGRRGEKGGTILSFLENGAVTAGDKRQFTWQKSGANLVLTESSTGTQLQFSHADRSLFGWKMWGVGPDVLETNPHFAVRLLQLLFGVLILSGSLIILHYCFNWPGRIAVLAAFSSWMATALLVRIAAGSLGVFWDAAIPLNGGWRILSGQVPHHDFITPLGPIVYYLTAFSLKLTGPNLRSLDVGAEILFIVLSVWSYFVARSRFGPPGAALFAVAVGSFLITPAMFAHTPDYQGYAGYYNSIGVGVLCTILFDAIAPYRSNGDLGRESFVLGLSSGALAVAVGFVKITFGIAAAGAVLAALLFNKRGRLWIAGMVAGGTVSLVACLLLIGFDLGSLIDDLRMASVARHFGKLSDTLIYVLGHTYGPLIGGTLLVVTAAGSIWKGNWRELLSPLLGCAVVLGVGVFLASSSTQVPELGVDMVLPFALACFVLAKTTHPVVLSSFLLISTSLLAYSPSRNIQGLALLAARRVFQPYYAPPGAVSDAIKGADESERYASWAPMFDEAIQALRPRVTKKDRLFSVDAPDILSLGLGLRPPKNDLIYWHVGVTFSKDTVERFPRMAPDRIFGQITIIAVPKQPYIQSERYIFEYYKSYLDTCFKYDFETTNWRFLRRDSSSCPRRKKERAA